MRVDLQTLAGVLVYLALGLAGDLTLKHGMQQLPPIEGLGPGEWLRLARHVFTTPAVGIGVGLLAANFTMFLAVLSRADVSVVGPARALSYVLLALLARWVLHESVPPLRWAGVLLITAG